MRDLPADLLPPLEKALGEAEATFREAIGKREERSWPKIHAAIFKAMESSFASFSTQACLAVQQDQLTVSKARWIAKRFLEGRANALHEWLLPVMPGYLPGCPYHFRRYNSEDRFVFSRDLVEAVQSSETWVQFLRALAASAGGERSVIAGRAEESPQEPAASMIAAASASEPLEPPTQQTEKPHVPLPVNATSAQKRAAVAKYLDELRKKTGKRPPQAAIWRAASYATRAEYERWLRNDHRATNAADNNIRRILREELELID